MSPKEIAEKLRHWADSTLGSLRYEMRAFADELDPPKSTRPKPGTVVRFVDGGVGVAYCNGIAYVADDGFLESIPWTNDVTQSCKPVHILADDEVAVKRSELLKLANGERLLEENKYDEGDGRC